MDTTSPPPFAFTGPNRRRAPRYAVDLPIEIEWGSAMMPGRVRDLSLYGMHIELPDALWVGAQFSARLLLEQPVVVDCTVRRAQPGAMGISFTPADDDARARMEALISGLASS
jgi:hypothetical protein